MKLLLHVCCGPCLIYPLEFLKEKSFSIECFFYNPNIHPYAEYDKRLNTFKDLIKQYRLTAHFYQYDYENFFRRVSFNEHKPERCVICWRLRLTRTAEFAKENNFEFFSTTLLSSPYQDQQALKRIGEDIAKDYTLNFGYFDMRAGFKKAHEEAKKTNLYCQNYCGCVYSQVERYQKVGTK